MGPSTVKTITAPGSDAVTQAEGSVVAIAPSGVPLRVVVRNLALVGGGNVAVAYAADAFSGNLGMAFLIPPTQSETFVVAPTQGIYVAAVGAGGILVSIAISEAIGEVPKGANVRSSFVA